MSSVVLTLRATTPTWAASVFSWKRIKGAKSQTETQRGKNTSEVLCYCTISLLLLSSDRKLWRAYKERGCNWTICGNSKHPTHPLNQPNLSTFVSFRVCLYIFKQFYSFPSRWVCSMWWEKSWHIQSPGPEKFGFKIKPQTPVGQQAVILTAHIKNSLDGQLVCSQPHRTHEAEKCWMFVVVGHTQWQLLLTVTTAPPQWARYQNRAQAGRRKC